MIGYFNEGGKTINFLNKFQFEHQFSAVGGELSAYSVFCIFI